ncbi:phosphotransacetylase [Amedibacillus sp. YH-ame10]
MILNIEQNLLRKHPRIGFAEGAHPEVIKAAVRHENGGVIIPVLIGDKKEILKSAKEIDVDISGVEIADATNFPNKAEMVDEMITIQRGRWSKEECMEKLQDLNYFSTMYLEAGYIDGLVGGVKATTAQTMRPALQLIKTAPQERIVSSCVLLERGEVVYIMGDCTLNVNPNVDELVEITLQCARTARQFGIEPKVGLLSYSSFGSGSGVSVDKVREAVTHLKRMPLDFEVDGEIQADTAISPTVASIKAKGSTLAGHMNTLIFPNIDAGNITYKIAVELGGFKMFGPILQGLKKPVNILTRLTHEDTIYSIALITGIQAIEANRSV